jgi:hypothetical protein
MNFNTVNLVSLKPASMVGRELFFDDVIQSVKFVLESVGRKVYISENKIVIDAINFVFGSGTHLFPDIDQFRRFASPRNVVIFNMEQLASESGLITDRYLDLLSDYTVLDYSFSNVSTLKQLRPDSRAVEFPVPPVPIFGADSQFSGLGAGSADVAFYGSLSEHRQKKLLRLTEAGLTVKILYGFGVQLAKQLSNCRSVINIHNYSTSIFEIARVLRPVSMGVPVFSEESVMPATGGWDEAGVEFFDSTSMIQKIATILRSPDLLQRMTRDSIRLTTSRPWQGEAMRALDYLARCNQQ